MNKSQEEEIQKEYKKIGTDMQSLSVLMQQFGKKVFALFKRTSAAKDNEKIEELRKQILKG
jgi:hypothetical protein